VRVDWAIPCRFVEVQPQSGATIVGAGADVVHVPSVPTPVQVLFAVRYVGAPEEVNGETAHSIVCRIFNPVGDRVDEQTGQLMAHGTQMIPGYVAEIIVPSGVVIDAQQFGTYGVEFSIDEDTLRRVPIHVVEALAAGA
jgi:hypothetical protein